MSKTGGIHRSYLVTIALAAGTLAYVFGVFLPKQRSVAAIRTEIAQKQEFISHSAMLTAEIEAAEREQQETEQFVTAQRAILPRENVLPRVHAELSRAASEAGVTLMRFDPQPLLAFETFRQAPLTIVCEGRFEQVFDFVRRMEELKKLVWVDHMQLGKPEETSEIVRCELSLVVFADKSDTSD